MLKLIHDRGLETCLREITEYVESDFKRWPLFDKSPRVASHSKVGVIELMPTSDGTDYAFKFVNGHPSNTKIDLQTVTAFGVIASVETGYPELFSEMTLLTALRTAATSAMATKALAPKGAKTAAIIGNGAQSEFQILALSAVCGINSFRLYDIEPKATARCNANLKARGLSLVTCKSTEEAVQGADIITTCTADKSYQTILTDNLIGSGLHINAIGGDCPGKTELHKDILLKSEIFVEYPEQTRIEGDIQQLAKDHPVTELWQVLTGEAAGRSSDDQITVFDGVGFAIEDFSALRWLRDQVNGGASSEPLDLIADPDDPKDLFGMTERYAASLVE
jgi:ornithine cyclodeaminase